ncbi:MAG: citrate/2-methylcitrate synthase [Lachnospiraceae bacterium]|nr:citrate/2-methylcitrate synthase [Lachnospiraceae bacterium]
MAVQKKDPHFTDITPEIQALADICKANDIIDPMLFFKYNVKRGLRDVNGKGVLTGLTEIAEVKSYTIDDDEIVPCEGKLYYRGYEIRDLVNAFTKERRFGFEETTYLLIFGKLPTEKDLKGFNSLLAHYRSLPTNFVRDVVMKAPTREMMNTLSRSILTLYPYDNNPDDVCVDNVLRQCLQLIAVTPLLAVYGYHTYRHYKEGGSLVIHQPDPSMSTAETILHLLRDDSKFTKFEASVLDLCLVLHADHGGGNNSTFTNRVVTSTLTDTYSAISASLASLRRPRHGGANLKVVGMMDDIKAHVNNLEDDEELTKYLKKILRGKAYDKQGLIYGMGHAVYTISDPRAVLLKKFVERLAEEKGAAEEFKFYQRIERLAPQIIMEGHDSARSDIAVNVDFYSGLVYRLLGLPEELFTPLFAIARMSGWAAHRLEELATGGKIIRPAYKNIVKHAKYVPIKKR